MSQCEIFGISLMVGSASVVAWPILLYVVYFAQWVWAWIDDTTNEERNNILVQHLMRMLGYEYREGWTWKYYKLDSSDKSDGDIVVCGGMLVVFFLPPIVCLSYMFYPVAIGIILAILLAFVARMARRQSKLLVSHINNKNAHK